MSKVLITGGLSTLAQRVAKSIVNNQVLFADSVSIPEFLNEKFVRIPDSQKASFLHELLKLCLDLSVDCIIPLKQSEMLILADSRLLFEEYGITLCLPERQELNDLERVIDPTRLAYPELIVHKDPNDLNSMLGVFVRITTEEIALCCVN